MQQQTTSVATTPSVASSRSHPDSSLLLQSENNKPLEKELTILEDVAKTDDGMDSEDEEEEKHQYKVIIVGDGTVGKSSTIRRFTEDEFQQSYVRTVGVDWFIKNVSIVAEGPLQKTNNKDEQGKLKKIEVTFQIWDIEGQALGSKILASYIYGSDAVILTYDITNPESFQNLNEWLKYVKHIFSENYEGKRKTDKPKDPLICVFANKCDLSHERKVKREMHDEWTSRNGLQSYFVSAKTGDMVNISFIKLAALLAGVQLPQGQLDGATKVIVAPIINYGNPSKEEKPKEEKPKETIVRSRTCIIS
ncbi:hypothetical protein C9374_011075 [Naegleria lovaniensis]|uniref:Rab family small GTPase n=1 Tax=Naegleria lovaniensis TaxID=51637 RepID=A0AA88KDL6_NAELO|nr:uncharacterized protein C9374_011075 [Naegleria lovaniensis]KAG2374238.1 hypothetical protein C9374_011075 [Naegleria lovaniensis]